MSQPHDPRDLDRLAAELSRIRDPQALAEAILAAARAAQPLAAAPQPGSGGPEWIEA